mmetsp:Transcript_56288/g.132639  ORF Transcript_56288/g.132639 Transcript_56288/m.132639 type:complete len:144 (-) Transcript_56288:28-459(-)|eukprot:CAMPEP_0177713692 /NCGR_PEP_ID=MMETSP0484_2-20121128/13074_1 /TAXON_ID=354590 /ORGANISM="Rhodomonas lens, Strain RHODO" /LENGTH=143 /DNA_ID=CAMNT_0019225597 /DNA_START=244 /DNA_END=675 /DNA_ORIENTATION=+
MTDTTVSITSEGGEQFFKHFYNYMDTSRQNLKHLYHEESKVVWNGTSLAGRANVEKFITDLPSSTHKPYSLDCQPISPQAMPGAEPADPMILVSVMGTVQFGSLESNPPPVPRPFCQSFVLGKDAATGSYFIVTDNYRFLTDV